jgi:hypothetical protein
MDVASGFLIITQLSELCKKYVCFRKTVIERKCGSFHDTMGDFLAHFQPYTVHLG